MEGIITLPNIRPTWRDRFPVQIAKFFWPDCPCCESGCPQCLGSESAETYEFTFSGATADSCNQVSKINKTHQVVGDGSDQGGECFWSSESFFTLCGLDEYFWRLIADGVFLRTELELRSIGGSLEVIYRLSSAPDFPDCLADRTLAKVSGGSESKFHWPSSVTVSPV